MATDSNGLVYENRTLQFYGYAYGTSNVSITASINNNVVFSGEIPTINSEIPILPINFDNEVVLFSLDNTELFPTNWSGSIPMTISVNSGTGAVFNNITSNYMPGDDTIPTGNPVIMENSSITGTTLNIGSIVSGDVTVGKQLSGTGVLPGTVVMLGSGTTWTVTNPQTVSSTTITGQSYMPAMGTIDNYTKCYKGIPVNSENTPDPRSSVTVDGLVQVPPIPVSTGVWGWVVPAGSVLAYNLNISPGNCAQ